MVSIMALLIPGRRTVVAPLRHPLNVANVPRVPRLPAFSRTIAARIAKLAEDEQTALIVLSAGIGAAAGLAVAAFYRFIDIVQRIVLRGPVELQRIPAWIIIPLVVLIGLALARACVAWGAHGSDGENVPDVMYRVGLRNGFIHLMPVVWKTLAAGLMIGTGGSVGAEGPVIVAGAGTASKIGRWLHASPSRLKTLAGCGAAAGLSAAFNAPIAGVIFGVEKILGTTGGLALAPLVVASILATTVGRIVFGNRPVLGMPVAYGGGDTWHLLLYLFLGITTGAVGALYSRGAWRVQDWLARLKDWQKLLLAGLAVGALDVLFQADLWGRGHQALNLAIIGQRGTLYLVGLTAAKLVATWLTLGASGAGGVFTPALYIGATLGGVFAGIVHLLLPGLAVAPGGVALVGMAGLVAGATHAPLTAIVMVFEMTGDYALILPLMLTATLAHVVARRLWNESIYTEWLVRKGIHLGYATEAEKR